MEEKLEEAFTDELAPKKDYIPVGAHEQGK
jgi:hypothetical protein